MAKKRKGKHMQGKGGMHIQSLAGKDSMAHSSHHAANKEHGMHQGFSPASGYQQGPTSPGCCHKNDGGADVGEEMDEGEESE